MVIGVLELKVIGIVYFNIYTCKYYREETQGHD